MTIKSFNSLWRPPLLFVIWVAAVILVWVEYEPLNIAAGSALGVFSVLSLLDSRVETRIVVAVVSVLGAGMLWTGGDPARLLIGLERTLIFAALLPTLVMVRLVAANLEFVRLSQQRIAELPTEMSGVGFLFGAHAFGAVLNTGAFALTGSVVPKDMAEKDRRSSALAALRGMNTVALYTPFFVGFGVAFTYLPDVPVWQVFLLGGSLAVTGLLISVLLFARPLRLATLSRGLACLAPVALPMLLIVALVVAASQLLPISTLGAVVSIMPILMALYLVGKNHLVPNLIIETRGAMSRMGDDLAIISAAMMLGALAETAPIVTNMLAPLLSELLPSWAAIATTAISMVSFAIIGIHPMITAAVVMAAIKAAGLEVEDLPLMLAMLYGWGIGSMNSISSLSVITAGTMFRVPPLRLAFGPNLIFAALFGVVVVIILTALNAWMLSA